MQRPGSCQRDITRGTVVDLTLELQVLDKLANSLLHFRTCGADAINPVNGCVVPNSGDVNRFRRPCHSNRHTELLVIDLDVLRYEVVDLNEFFFFVLTQHDHL